MRGGWAAIALGFTFVLAAGADRSAADQHAASVDVGLASYTFVDSAHGDTIAAAIWYPSSDAPRDTVLALQRLHVAIDGAYVAASRGGRRALVVVSHGTGGDQFGHWDTAEALARAGFIVATIRHAGDNSRDHSGLGTDRYLYGRPEQISRLLDRLLADSTWGRRIDAARIGFFGYSAGGFTGLELLGARPNLALLAPYCRRHPSDQLYCAGGLHGRFEMTGRYPVPSADTRVRSAVLWAPAFSFLFDRAGLTTVREPLLIERAADDSLVLEPDNVLHLLAALLRRPTERVVAGAGHYAFLAPCGGALARVVPEICEDPPGFDRTAVHTRLDRELVEFFEGTLGG